MGLYLEKNPTYLCMMHHGNKRVSESRQTAAAPLLSALTDEQKVRGRTAMESHNILLRTFLTAAVSRGGSSHSRLPDDKLDACERINCECDYTGAASLHLGCREPRAEARLLTPCPSAPLANLCGVWAKNTHTHTRY